MTPIHHPPVAVIRIKQRNIGYITVIEFPKELDISVLMELRGLFEQVLSYQIKDFIFDFAEVAFIHKGILNLMTYFARMLKGLDGRLFFMNPSPAVMREVEAIKAAAERAPTFPDEAAVEEFIVHDDKLLAFKCPVFTRAS